MTKAYLLLVFCVAARTWAQTPARYTLRGSVVNAVTGEPIHKANVTLNGQQNSSALTGPDGQFDFEGLQPGSYFISAVKPGFADPRMSSTPPATVQVAADVSPVAIKLVPFGTMAGRVVDSDGEPVPNLSLQSMYRVVQMGHVIWQPGSAANTDENGNFALDALQPGQYLVAVRDQQVYPGLAGTDSGSRLLYRGEYFPDSPDIASAQPIEITGGETAQADLTVSEIQGSAIHFAVVPPQQWVQVTLRNANGDETNAPARREQRSGEWIVSGISPGRWLLDVQMNTNGQQLSGSAAVELGDTDARNVVVTLSGSGQVPVLFSGESNAQNGSLPANVSLLSLSGSGIRPFSPTLSVEPGGTHYSVFGLPPGSYRAQVNSYGSQCVDAITSGPSDLARVDYVMPESGAAQPISVSLGSDCATVDFSATQKTGPFFFAVIVGGVFAREPLMLAGGDTAQATLAPGEYDVYAFTDVNKVEYANPEVLRNFAGRHISVSSNQKASYKLDLNKVESK